jgi:hypothetical protein
MSKQVILYNGVSIFPTQATPFISKGVENIQVGERWGQKETWTLNGFLTGCDFAGIVAQKNSLLSNFTKMVGELSIGSEIDISPAFVDSIDVDESNYIGHLPYSISFSSYPSGGFAGTYYGVTDVSDDISYTENTDQTLGMVRTIRAKGLQTDQNSESSLRNARNFVSGRMNVPVMKPFIITTTGTNLSYYLESSEESMDRINNSFTVTQNFKTDLSEADGNIINRYTIEEKKAVSEMTVISYRGQIDAGKYGSLENLRQKYIAFRNSIAATFLLDESVTEDLKINRITYNFSYNKDAAEANFPEILDDYTITVMEDSSSSLFTASIDGNVSANYGCPADRMAKIEQRVSEIDSANWNFDVITEIYNNFYTTDRSSKQAKPSLVSLNPRPLSENKSIDSNAKTIGYSAYFNDRFIPAQLLECNSFDASVTVKLPIYSTIIKEHYRGGYYICQDLGSISRMSVSVSATRDAYADENFAALFSLTDGIMGQWKKNNVLYVEPYTYSVVNGQRKQDLTVSSSFRNDGEVFEIT